MKKLTAVAATLVLGVAGTALADPPTEPGTPGEANCKGQTIAYLAQFGKTDPLPERFRGLGGIAKAAGLTVKEVHAVVEDYCDGP